MLSFNKCVPKQLFCFLFLNSVFISAQDTKYPPQWEQTPPPECATSRICTPEEVQAYLKDLHHWRDERLQRIGYSDAEYSRPALQWAQKSFVQPQAMMEDRYLYDPEHRRYTVDRYLDDLEKRYGGIDSVLLWHTYPNIGIDSRNQFDLFRDLPGGLDGVRSMIADFHRRGVRVLFPVMLWDRGTRDEGAAPWDSISKLLAEVDADGINGDTLDGIPRTFRTVSDALNHPLLLEPEVGLGNEERLAWNNATWGYWEYKSAPTVSTYKWLEPRHMVHVCDRWKHDHTDNLQYAFFNGTGFESWENVWSIWNQMTPRDAEALRRISSIERAFPDLLISKDWEPHTPVLRSGVFASKFSSANASLWTVVNRNDFAVKGPQLRIAAGSGARYFDLWHGEELKSETQSGQVVLSFELDRHGYGSILQISTTSDDHLSTLLARMRELSRLPLTSFSSEWHPLTQKIVEIPRSPVADATQPGMIRVPGGTYSFRASGVEIEGGNDVGVDIQYPWEDAAVRHHLHTLSIDSFFIDKHPVTNAEFKRFVDATKYRPMDDHNFLKHWKNGNYPDGWGEKPVVWVSLEDARAYAAWAGKRLPHEWEWQFAAQGNDGRQYPWGDAWKEDAVPQPDKGRAMRPPDDVEKHPSGNSALGISDLVGLTWQWTDEYTDEHTRSAVLKGGSYYQPQGSAWYFPQAYRLHEHGKYLLLSPGKDRSGTVGFRCVKDAR